MVRCRSKTAWCARSNDLGYEKSVIHLFGCFTGGHGFRCSGVTPPVSKPPNRNAALFIEKFHPYQILLYAI
ncbi:hypothetical protein M378DRAFT_155218 [Amanita muscaria Koide BX008]|uniref:Uncharacterized protein n=1 Tax=Amanita muscaria (strain Koide BX008) TaxID=946122 RepID=A0A0C2TW32_AMAMK|nr:hypothetical protein M378DRAFT_155218 [Amanita muscaria Koide BX008]